MRYSYKEVFDLRDFANKLLQKHISTHEIVIVAKWEFVDVCFKNISDSSEIIGVENVSRDECYRWIAGFITAMELKETKIIDVKNSWWSKKIRPILGFSNIK